MKENRVGGSSSDISEAVSGLNKLTVAKRDGGMSAELMEKALRPLANLSEKDMRRLLDIVGRDSSKDK